MKTYSIYATEETQTYEEYRAEKHNKYTKKVEELLSNVKSLYLNDNDKRQLIKDIATMFIKEL